MGEGSRNRRPWTQEARQGPKAKSVQLDYIQLKCLQVKQVPKGLGPLSRKSVPPLLPETTEGITATQLTLREAVTKAVWYVTAYGM